MTSAIFQTPYVGPIDDDLVIRHYTLDPRKFKLTYDKTVGRPRGSFGDVYKAILEVNGSRYMVAVKFITYRGNPVGQEKHKQRLAREALAWSHSIQHRNICPFYGLWHDEKKGQKFAQPFGLVSPWVAHDIMEYLEANPDRKADAIQQLATGLCALHESGVYHGDLKADNVRVDDNGVVTIHDFGQGRIGGIANFFTSTMGRNPLYIAPELLRAAKPKPTAKSDVYSFGMMILRLLHGRDEVKGTDGYVIDKGLPYQIPPGYGLYDHVVNKEGRPILENYNTEVQRHGALLQDTWKDDPSLRPTMATVLAELVKLNQVRTI